MCKEEVKMHRVHFPYQLRDDNSNGESDESTLSLLHDWSDDLQDLLIEW